LRHAESRRVGAYKILVYTDDHPPPHVPVRKGRGVVRILLTSNGVVLDAVKGALTTAEIRRAGEAVLEHLEECWRFGGSTMAELQGFDRAGITEARRRGQRESATDATRVAYLPESDAVSIVLRNGTVVSVPRTSIVGLKGIPKGRLATLRLSPLGDAIDLPVDDVHISVKGVVRKAVLGEDLYSKAGRTKSSAKAAAARRNGTKGGRPRRVA
jgi:hypothetical protein